MYQRNSRPVYKTEMCRILAKFGVCSYEQKCHFAHNVNELQSRPIPPKYKEKACIHFHTPGSICFYDSKCLFIHEYYGSDPGIRADITALNNTRPEIWQHPLVNLDESTLTPMLLNYLKLSSQCRPASGSKLRTKSIRPFCGLSQRVHDHAHRIKQLS